MIQCGACKFNPDGFCHRYPPAFFPSGVGRKWVFPLIPAFEGFRGCGEGERVIPMAFEPDPVTGLFPGEKIESPRTRRKPRRKKG